MILWARKSNIVLCRCNNRTVLFAEMDAWASTENMARRIARSNIDTGAVTTSKAPIFGADLAFLVGDLSYATGYLGKWESFMNAIEPVSANVPFMVGQVLSSAWHICCLALSP